MASEWPGRSPARYRVDPPRDRRAAEAEDGRLSLTPTPQHRLNAAHKGNQATDPGRDLGQGRVPFERTAGAGCRCPCGIAPLSPRLSSVDTQSNAPLKSLAIPCLS